MHVPPDPGRERLRLVVVPECGEIPPRGIAAHELHRRGGKEKPEEEPPRETERAPGGGRIAPRARPEPPRREEDGEKPRFEQKPVPLKPEEFAAHGGEREIGGPESDQTRPGGQAQKERRRERDPCPAERREKPVRRREPAQGRGDPVAAQAERRRGADHLERLIRGQDSPASDQAVHLDPERHERDPIDDREQTEVHPGRDLLAGRNDVRSPEPVGDAGEEGTVRRDDAVQALAQELEAGDVPVRPEPRPAIRRVGQGAKDRFRAPGPAPVRLQEMNRLRERRGRYVGHRGGDLLERRVAHAVAGDTPPPLDPSFTEIARPVVDENRRLTPLDASSPCSHLASLHAPPAGGFAHGTREAVR